MKKGKEHIAVMLFDDDGNMTGAEWKEELIRCQDCKHYMFGSCYGWGKQEQMKRNSDDYCSKGERL